MEQIGLSAVRDRDASRAYYGDMGTGANYVKSGVIWICRGGVA